jgi:hypothetical protein
MMGREQRLAARLKVEIPTVVESIPANAQNLPTGLQAVYERVNPASDYFGKPTMFTVRDVSTNGAFLEGPALSLLSRVRFKLPFGSAAEPEAIAWVMWRRLAPCMIDGRNGPVTLEPGIGVLFESFPLDVRVEIASRATAVE